MAATFEGLSCQQVMETASKNTRWPVRSHRWSRLRWVFIAEACLLALIAGVVVLAALGSTLSRSGDIAVDSHRSQRALT